MLLGPLIKMRRSIPMGALGLSKSRQAEDRVACRWCL
jgi:hypothetical protein